MPTPTDLVTDLPADFEVFGQAVDTSMADLKGGTTGQILSKNSNTDMDFIWIANDQGDITGVTATSPLTGGGTSGAITVGIQAASTSQSGAVQLTDSTSSTSTTTAATPNSVKSSYDLANAAIPKSTVTTNGDLIYGTGSSTVTRLGIGSSGQVLSVSGGVPAWATPSGGSSNVAGKNVILNSNFSVWQRGTTFTIPSGVPTYFADRFQITRSATGCTGSRQATSDSTNLPFVQYCARIARDSGNSATTAIYLTYSMDTVNAVQLAGKTITLSYYARRGANYSATSNALGLYIATGTGTDQNVNGGYTGSATVSTSATLTTTWQRFTYSMTVPSTTTELGFYFEYNPTGTAGAADYFEITGVQMEIASSASVYSPNAATYQAELAACQRYYQRKNAGQAYTRFAIGQNVSATQAGFVIPFGTQMRTTPSFACSSGDWDTVEGTSSRGTNAPTLSSDGSGLDSAFIYTAITSGTTGYAVQLRSRGVTTTWLEFSAEL